MVCLIIIQEIQKIIIGMLTPMAQMLTLILTMVSLIGCIEKYDYNIIIGLGLTYLGSKHPYLYNLTSFYLLVALTIAVDIIQIVTLDNFNPFWRFVIPITQALIKVFIIVLQALNIKRNSAHSSPLK